MSKLISSGGCARAQNVPEDMAKSIRKDLFDTTEKLFLIGLRCRIPHVRQRFFRLWNETLPLTIYERLRFIISSQEWEHGGNIFWLKHGLVKNPNY
jgi:hypothetical protein